MSNKPRYGEQVGETEKGERVTLTYQMQVFMDELDASINLIEELKQRIEALENV